MLKVQFKALCIGFIILAGCNLKREAFELKNDKSSISPASNIHSSQALGDSVLYIFRGILPEVQNVNVEYILNIYSRRYSGDGNFALVKNSSGTDMNNRKTVIEGKRYTQRGSADDINATVWQMVSNDKKNIFNFLLIMRISS